MSYRPTPKKSKLREYAHAKQRIKMFGLNPDKMNEWRPVSPTAAFCAALDERRDGGIDPICN